MRLHRLKIIPLSPYETPLHSDTIFGSLCWLYARKSASELQEFLRFYLPNSEDPPPFFLSNAFPDDLLPLPLSAYFCLKDPDDPDQRKTLKNTPYITLELFNRIRRCERFSTEDPDVHKQLKLSEQVEILRTITLHNTINRLTGTTGDPGSLYELEEYIPVRKLEDRYSPTHLSIYLYINEGWENDVMERFEELSLIGFGKDKSTGKGTFRVEALEPFHGFDHITDPHAFISLSNFCPARADPTEGLWRPFVKFGKLGEEFAISGYPFKRPILMLQPGSIFRAELSHDPPYGRFGRLVHRVVADRFKQWYRQRFNTKEDEVPIFQYAFAFPVPSLYPEVNADAC